MYSIYANDKLLLQSDLHSRPIIDGKISQKINTTDAWDFTVLSANPLFDALIPNKTGIKVCLDGDEIWSGGITGVETSIDGRMTVTVENELAFLRGTYHEPFRFNGSAKSYFGRILSAHNESTGLPAYQKILGQSDIAAEYACEYTEPVSHFDMLKDAIDEIGGYLIRTGGLWLWTLTPETIATDLIEGVNLLELDVETPGKDFATALYPLGDDGLTVRDVNADSPIVEDAALSAIYGRSVAIRKYDGVTDPGVLLAKAQSDLADPAHLRTVSATALLRGGNNIRPGSRARLVLKNGAWPDWLPQEDSLLVTEAGIDLTAGSKCTVSLGEMPRLTAQREDLLLGKALIGIQTTADNAAATASSASAAATEAKTAAAEAKATADAAVTTADEARNTADTAKLQAQTAMSSAAGKAPMSHAASGTTHGKGTDGLYGHVKLSDSVSSTSSAASGGTAATPAAVKAVHDLLGGAKVITGTATIDYGTSMKYADVTFGYTFQNPPFVIAMQVFNGIPLACMIGSVTKTGARFSLQGDFTSSGSREFRWLAVGV